MTPSTTATSTNTSVERWARIARLWHIARGSSGRQTRYTHRVRGSLWTERHRQPRRRGSRHRHAPCRDRVEPRDGASHWHHAGRRAGPARRAPAGVPPRGPSGRPAQACAGRRVRDRRAALRGARPARPRLAAGALLPWHGRTGELAGVVGGAHRCQRGAPPRRSSARWKPSASRWPRRSTSTACSTRSWARRSRSWRPSRRWSSHGTARPRRSP